jgi:hypothetical protein
LMVMVFLVANQVGGLECGRMRKWFEGSSSKVGLISLTISPDYKLLVD